MDAHGQVIRKKPKPDYAPWDPARANPLSYEDPGTSITFYVESDGRHLAAMDSQGNLLWVRNPWEDAHAFCCSSAAPRAHRNETLLRRLPFDPLCDRGMCPL